MRTSYNFVDRTGRRYGRLTVTDLADGRGTDGSHRWLCRCDCGNNTTVTGTNLTSRRTIGCGCLWKKPPGEAARNRLLLLYRTSARKRGHSWDLADEDFFRLVSLECFYCGSLPALEIKGNLNGGFIYNGLDRVDNTLGYALENVVTCCITCNEAKRAKPYGEFIEWIGRLAARQAEHLLLLDRRRGELTADGLLF